MDTITRMRAFVAVVDSGGFSAAARVTGRSKALMSKYIAELEDELGARLLNRTTRQLSMTEAGQAAYDESQKSFVGSAGFARRSRQAHLPRGAGSASPCRAPLGTANSAAASWSS
jgi:DNA-binding transcriptional LysR family regulator